MFYKLYYNLGNAYYKNNQLENIIITSVQKLNHQDDDKNNLTLVYTKTIDKIVKENFYQWLKLTYWVFPIRQRAWLSIGKFFVFLVFIFVYRRFIGGSETYFFFRSFVFISYFLRCLFLRNSAKSKRRKQFQLPAPRNKVYTEPTSLHFQIWSRRNPRPHSWTKCRLILLNWKMVMKVGCDWMMWGVLAFLKIINN